MSYAYSYPSVGDYQFVWIDGEESDGIITAIRLGTTDVQIDGITHTFLNEEIEAWAEAAPDWVGVAINHPRHTITASWLDPSERVAWLNWTYRAWGVETPVSGDALARATNRKWHQAVLVASFGEDYSRTFFPGAFS